MGHIERERDCVPKRERERERESESTMGSFIWTKTNPILGGESDHSKNDHNKDSPAMGAMNKPGAYAALSYMACAGFRLSSSSVFLSVAGKH